MTAPVSSLGSPVFSPLVLDSEPPITDAPIPRTTSEPPFFTSSFDEAEPGSPTPPFNVRVEAQVRGSYFRKLETPPDVNNRGISASGVLPTLSFDPSRNYVDPAGADSFRTGPLDRPSVYLGGLAAGHQLDAGLTWDRVYDNNARPLFTDLPCGSDGRDPTHQFVLHHDADMPSITDGNGQVVASGDADVAAFKANLQPDFAFRPYWRTTNASGNQWNQPKPAAADNLYFYPCERFTMSVREAGPDQVQLSVALTNSDPPIEFSRTFDQQGFGVGQPQSFKRVNSIDQFTVDPSGKRVGNEGESVLPTLTSALGASWDSVTILGETPDRDVPMAGSDFTVVQGGDTAGRYAKIFQCSPPNARGGESIDIVPSEPIPTETLFGSWLP